MKSGLSCKKEDRATKLEERDEIRVWSIWQVSGEGQFDGAGCGEKTGVSTSRPFGKSLANDDRGQQMR